MTDAPFRRQFDAARDPYAARNALGITGPGGGGGGGGAPIDAQYIVAVDDPTLTNDRVLTNTATVTWDFSTAGQAKANATGATDTEAVQDIVGGMWQDTARINVTYDDAFNRISADIWGSSLDNSVLAFMADSTIKGRVAGSGSGNPVDLTPAQVLTAIGAAPLASPTFTGDPKAPTPSVGDNDTSIATTAFVTAAVAAGGGGGTATPVPPQGRLTLVTATPVMTTTQSAKTTIFYTPYVGNQVPIYNGTSMTMTTFAELSVATTDTTKSPAAIGASKVNDWFVWSDAGTIRIGHGPDWTSDTARSAGTALVMVNGIWLNNVAITNGPAAQRGTYVGTTRSNASSQLDWIYGGLAATGTAGFFGLWNAYNRVLVASSSRDTTSSWTYSAVAWRAANGSTSMRCSVVRGLDEDAVSAQYICSYLSGVNVSIGIGLDTTTNFTGTTASVFGTGGVYQSGTATFNGLPGLGLHYLQAVEFVSTSGGATFIGSSGVSYVQTGLNALFRA